MENIKNKIFGDFQTPLHLVEQIYRRLSQKNIQPSVVIEPTCGQGNFLKKSLEYFPNAQNYIGLEINKDYLDTFANHPKANSFTLYHDNFFNFNWQNIINQISGTLCVIGNPPWVTNSTLGGFKSDNLPHKNNLQNFKGLDALTGKSNFDICEAIILEQIEWFNDKAGHIIMICKTATARKILLYLWKNRNIVPMAEMCEINAFEYFNVSVDACVFMLDFEKKSQEKTCRVFKSLNTNDVKHTISFQNNLLIYHQDDYQKYLHLMNYHTKEIYWRSGLKHDCAKVMELEKTEYGYRNGYQEVFDLEDDFIYPLYKSSDLNKEILFPRKHVLVTQKNIQDCTKSIAKIAPKTWDYLQKHQDVFRNRKSIIYQNKDPFCMFGIGDYSFLPWKIAISGFDKILRFRLVSPLNKKPCMFDDTVAFIGFPSQKEAENVFLFLQKIESKKFLESMIFWDNKRPITIDILKRIKLPISQENDLFSYC